MTAPTDYAALLTLANTVATTYEPNKVTTAHLVTFAVLHAGTATPTAWARRVDGNNRRRTTVHRIVCVGNTSTAARRLANAMTDAIDGTPHDRAPWLVVYVSEPLEDRGDGSNVTWSSTVEIHHHTSRS